MLKCYEPTDNIDEVSARPNFMIPIYAAYLADGYKDDRQTVQHGASKVLESGSGAYCTRLFGN